MSPTPFDPPPLPHEHGAWFMLAIPLVLGAAVAERATLAAALVVPAMAGLFLARYAALPAAVRIAAGKPSPRSFLTRRLLWTAIYGAASLACLAGAFAAADPSHRRAIAACALVTAMLGGAHTVAAIRGVDRTVAGELVGMAGLASAAPLVAAAGGMPPGPRSIGVAILAFAYFVSSLAFVRAYRRLPEEGRAAKRRCVAAHLAIAAAILIVWKAGFVTGLALLALLPVAARTIWGLYRPPSTVRQLGWREAAVATVFVTAACAAIARGAESPDLTTVAERSGDLETGTYDEVGALVAAFERAFPGKVKGIRWGTSPEGRAMLAIVASEDGVLDPKAAKAKRRPVVLLQGGIHAGEIDGKDAGFRFLREALHGRAAKGALRAVTVVFVPVFNVDGHERRSAWSRPNQRGPRESGWRTTAQNLNLNRDYAKADAPEMRAMLALLRAWDPVLYVDLHVTDGAKFRHDISITVEPSEAEGHPLREPGRALRRRVVAALAASGHLPLEFYPSFVRDDDPASGFEVGVAPPRLSTPYWASHDRMGLLVETHSWRTYPERVRATFDALVAILDRAREDGAAWRAAADAADVAAREAGGKEVALRYGPGPTRTTLEFLGYAYTRGPSAVSGGSKIAYDETKPEIWSVPLTTDTKPTLVVRAPKAGYLVPPAWADVVERALSAHGLDFVRVGSPRASVPVEVFRASEVRYEPRSFEGRTRVEAKGAWTTESMNVPVGSLYVPIAQPGFRLVMHLLEPAAPDSLVAWGTFNVVFEQKEYMESYVAEELAERMLRDDEVLRAAFERAKQDPAFAADPQQRLDFFYRRSPYWDARMGLVPVRRVDRW